MHCMLYFCLCTVCYTLYSMHCMLHIVCYVLCQIMFPSVWSCVRVEGTPFFLLTLTFMFLYWYVKVILLFYVYCLSLNKPWRTEIVNCFHREKQTVFNVSTILVWDFLVLIIYTIYLNINRIEKSQVTFDKMY